MDGLLPDTSASAKRALVPPISPTSAVADLAAVMPEYPASRVNLRSQKLRTAAQHGIAREPPHLRLVEPGRQLPGMRRRVESCEQPLIGHDGYAFGLSRIEEQFVPADEMSNGLGAAQFLGCVDFRNIIARPRAGI